MCRILLLLLGALMCLDTGVLLFRSNPNLGVMLPLVMGLPLLVLGIFYTPLCTFFTSNAGRIVKWVLVCGYCLAAAFFFATSLFLYQQGHRTVRPGADALMVLGCGIHGERPTLTLTRRLDTAIAYLAENPDTLCFVSGGQSYGEDIPEAVAMRRYLVAHGVAEGRIVTEEGSESTRENFANTYPLILERCGADASIVYVTTHFHVYRAGRVAAAQGIAAQGLGAPGLWYITPNDYLRECVAMSVYWLRGWV